MKKKHDARVVRTMRCLKEALIELMSSNNLDAVRVQDICSLAGVNRGTFYKHFEDKYDLFNEILSDMVERISSVALEAVEGKDKDAISKTLVEVYMKFAFKALKFLKTHAQSFKGLTQNNKDSLAYFMFTNRIEEAFVNFLNQMRTRVTFEIPANVISRFCISGLSDLFLHWLENDEIENMQENLFTVKTILEHNLYVHTL